MKKLSIYEWVMLIGKILGIAAAIFIYGEKQLNAVNLHAEQLVAQERAERKEDFTRIDKKLDRVIFLLLKDQGDDP